MNVAVHMSSFESNSFDIHGRSWPFVWYELSFAFVWYGIQVDRIMAFSYELFAEYSCLQYVHLGTKAFWERYDSNIRGHFGNAPTSAFVFPKCFRSRNLQEIWSVCWN